MFCPFTVNTTSSIPPPCDRTVRGTVTFPLTLAAGTNVIVFKVINETNNWQGCVRLVDKDTKPVADLKLKTAP